MLSCLNPVKAACLSVTENTGHYEALDKTDEYCVWAEDGETDSIQSDNTKEGQTIGGYVDYFTRDEDDTAPDDFQAAFNSYGIGWRLESVQYEDDTRYIHYEWRFWVMNQL